MELRTARYESRVATKMPILPNVSKKADQFLRSALAYPPETVLFTALPMLCISSPMPRIVAHPSEVMMAKSNDQRSNFFLFIFTSRAVRSSKHARP